MRRFFITPRTLTWLGAATLFALTIFAYRPASHGGFVWDDDRYVTHNYLLSAPDGLRRIWCSLALTAKATACTLPAALLLILWLKKKPIGRRALLEIAPFVVLALGIGLVAVWWEKYHQGTRMLVSLGPFERLLIASRAVWFYLSKIFWPAKLTFIYPQWRIDPTNPIAYLWPIPLA